jgi:hypothetical protein
LKELKRRSSIKVPASRYPTRELRRTPGSDTTQHLLASERDDYVV